MLELHRSALKARLLRRRRFGPSRQFCAQQFRGASLCLRRRDNHNLLGSRIKGHLTGGPQELLQPRHRAMAVGASVRIRSQGGRYRGACGGRAIERINQLTRQLLRVGRARYQQLFAAGVSHHPYVSAVPQQLGQRLAHRVDRCVPERIAHIRACLRHGALLASNLLGGETARDNAYGECRKQ